MASRIAGCGSARQAGRRAGVEAGVAAADGGAARCRSTARKPATRERGIRVGEPGKHRTPVRIDDRRGAAAQTLDVPVAADAIDPIAANGHGFGKRRSRRRPCRRARCKSADRSGRCHRRVVRRRSGPATSVTPTIAATMTAVRRAAMAGKVQQLLPGRPLTGRLHLPCALPSRAWHIPEAGCGRTPIQASRTRSPIASQTPNRTHVSHGNSDIR